MKLPTRKQIKEKQETESPIEDILLRELHLAGLYPNTQFKVGKYRIDLAFPEYLLAIECDGKEWHSSSRQRNRDAEKDKFLGENGWRIIRITGSDIYRSADDIVKELIGGRSRRHYSYVRKEEIFRKRLEEVGEEEKDEFLLTGEELEDLANGVDRLDMEDENAKTGELLKVDKVIKERYKHGI